MAVPDRLMYIVAVPDRLMYIVEAELDMLQSVHSVHFGPRVRRNCCMECNPDLLDMPGGWKGNVVHSMLQAHSSAVIVTHLTRRSADCHFGSELKNL